MTGFDLPGREQSRPLFRLGQVVATPGALDVMERTKMRPTDLLRRHQRGDWGDLGPEDKAENELSVREGFRILSAHGHGNDKVWIITEADRSATTILTPSEY
jgi:hypothetical protein